MIAEPLPTEPLWSLEETATFLGLAPWGLRTMLKRRTGPPSYKVGKYRRFAPVEVRAWLQTSCRDEADG